MESPEPLSFRPPRGELRALLSPFEPSLTQSRRDGSGDEEADRGAASDGDQRHPEEPGQFDF